MSRRYHDEEWLREKYCEVGWTQREIAEACGVSPRVIRKYMDRFDIETRDIEGENHPLYGDERDERVKEAISEELSGRTFSADARERMSDSHLGNDIPSDVKAKISDSLTGVPKPPETRERMSKSRTGAAVTSVITVPDGLPHVGGSTSVTVSANSVVTMGRSERSTSTTSYRSGNFARTLIRRSETHTRSIISYCFAAPVIWTWNTAIRQLTPLLVTATSRGIYNHQTHTTNCPQWA